jgi:hypothetical protein
MKVGEQKNNGFREEMVGYIRTSFVLLKQRVWADAGENI